MVKLNRIYTRTGDKGTTALADGQRRSKADLRVETYGTVDETNACIGLARLHTQGPLDQMLGAIQNDLFESRVEQVQESVARATAATQRTLESAQVDGDSASLQSLMDAAIQSMTRQAGTDMIAGFRISNEPSVIAQQDFGRGGLTASMISGGLRETVQQSADKRWWQSIGLPSGDGDGDSDRADGAERDAVGERDHTLQRARRVHFLLVCGAL